VYQGEDLSDAMGNVDDLLADMEDLQKENETLTNVKIGYAQVDTLKIAGNAVTVHAHAQANGPASTVTCSLWTSQPATLSIFACISSTDRLYYPPVPPGGLYRAYLNGGYLEDVTAGISYDAPGDWGGYIYSQGMGGVGVFKVSVGAGTNTVTFNSSSGARPPKLSLLVMAAMR